MQPARKWDMFDVAKGDCELMDFLLVRYNPLDLQTRIMLDPKAPVQEQVTVPPVVEAAPPPPVPEAPLVVSDGQEMFTNGEATAVASQEVFTATAAVEEPPADPAAPMSPEDLQKLIAGFHQAAQQYTETSQWVDPDAPPGES